MGFAYSVGVPHLPLVYTHPVHHVAPVVYASNVCKNEMGKVVPCAGGTAHGIYAFADAPHFGVVPAPAAPATGGEEAVVSVEKREAEAEPEAEAEADPWLLYSGYYGHPGYYGYGYGLGYGWGGYYGLGYYGGCRNNAGALVPCAL